MSSVTTDASAAPALEQVARRSVSTIETYRELVEPDYAPSDAPRRVVPEWEVVYKIASWRHDVYAALRLVYKAYVRAGLSAKHPYRMRITPYHLLPTTEIFIAVQAEEVISTVSLVRDGELGLPMETLYGPEVESYRKHGFSLGEVSCLADCRQGQKRSVPVVMRLMSLMAQSAKRRGIDQLLIAVHPRHVSFYRRFTAFVPIGAERPYRTVCDNPAVPMALDLAWAPIDYPDLYAKFFGDPFPDDALEYRPMSDQLRSELDAALEANHAGDACSELDLFATC